MDECLAYDEELKCGGHFIGGDALGSSSNVVTLKMKGRGVAVINGLFEERRADQELNQRIIKLLE